MREKKRQHQLTINIVAHERKWFPVWFYAASHSLMYDSTLLNCVPKVTFGTLWIFIHLNTTINQFIIWKVCSCNNNITWCVYNCICKMRPVLIKVGISHIFIQFECDFFFILIVVFLRSLLLLHSIEICKVFVCFFLSKTSFQLFLNVFFPFFLSVYSFPLF